MSGLIFPDSYAAALSDAPAGAVVRAGGTDLQERLRTHHRSPAIVDLTRIPGAGRIEVGDDRTVVGAGATISAVAERLAERYPALAITAGGLATPQVRAVGTIGGNLVQHTRCWYYRHPVAPCLRKGDDVCGARTGRHLYGVVFDRADCVHPHPSSIAMALLTYDATVELSTGASMTVADLLGDGTGLTAEGDLPAGALIAAIHLPAPWGDERAAYFRTISRFEAEWPLVEAVVRARLAEDGTVVEAALGLGGVATVPLRMTDAESRLVGRRLDAAVIDEVADACTDGADPLPETGYKVDLVRATVAEVLERLTGG